MSYSLRLFIGEEERTQDLVDSVSTDTDFSDYYLLHRFYVSPNHDREWDQDTSRLWTPEGEVPRPSPDPTEIVCIKGLHVRSVACHVRLSQLLHPPGPDS